MTTLELIEKHGIGHNCLSDAYDLGYQKGRADAEAEQKEMCATCIHKVSADDIKAIEKKAREDAIDECIQFIKDHSGEHYIDCDGYFGCELETVFNLDNWMDDLDQLKKQK